MTIELYVGRERQGLIVPKPGRACRAGGQAVGLRYVWLTILDLFAVARDRDQWAAQSLRVVADRPLRIASASDCRGGRNADGKDSRHSPWARVADWQRMLDELAAAKTCLCDPAAKSLYDEELKKRASKSRRKPAGKNLLPPSKSTPPQADRRVFSRR